MTAREKHPDPDLPEFDDFEPLPFRGRISQRSVPGGTLIEIFVPHD